MERNDPIAATRLRGWTLGRSGSLDAAGPNAPAASCLVLGAEDAAALQLGHHLVYEVIDAARNVREHHVESVAGTGLEPFLHLVSDGHRRAHDGCAGVAAQALGELSNGQVLTSRQGDGALAAALACLVSGISGNGASGSKARASTPSAMDSEADRAVVVHKAVEQRPLLARLLDRRADDDQRAGQDLDVVGGRGRTPRRGPSHRL